MMDINKQTTVRNSNIGLTKQRNYNEIIEFLDNSWNVEIDKSLDRIKKIDTALNSPSKDLNAIFVSGTNGKSLTINFTAQLLKEDGLSVGGFYSPHILTYNERFSLNNETLSNKTFTEIGNEVITTIESLSIKANSLEILTMMAILLFKNNNVDVAIFEVSQNCSWDPVNICNPKVLAITRVTSEMNNETSEKIKDKIKSISEISKKGTWVISADQSKLNLQVIQDYVTEKEAQWAMPIRKLISLPYPFEQLHGRCAALAERTAQIYSENFIKANSTVVSTSLLIKPEGKRGRPTIEAKRQSEINPKHTLEKFWKETVTTLPGRFQLLDKEKPSLLLDTANNVDALSNLLLGIRLLHYQRSLKGLTIIIGSDDESIHTQEFLKLIRYFFKKTSGQIIFCPMNKNLYNKKAIPLNVEKITNDVKNHKVKAKAAKNFADAFETAKQSVDERHGLVVITGSETIINEYWNYKGIKKL